MPLDQLDREGVIAFTAAENTSIHDMGTYSPDEVLNEAQMKISKIDISKIVFTKEYSPYGSFECYKSRTV